MSKGKYLNLTPAVNAEPTTASSDDLNSDSVVIAESVDKPQSARTHKPRDPVSSMEDPASTIFRANKFVIMRLKSCAMAKGITLQRMFEEALCEYLRGESSIPGITDIETRRPIK